MEDLLQDFRKTTIILPTGARYPILLFADDTLLITATAADMTKMLDLVITHSAPYNLRLNTEKCHLLVTNDPGLPVHFPNGQEEEPKNQIRYLGALVSATLDGTNHQTENCRGQPNTPHTFPILGRQDHFQSMETDSV